MDELGVDFQILYQDALYAIYFTFPENDDINCGFEKFFDRPIVLHRLACFRDDVVFVIFLYQRWIYRVDPKRVNEVSVFLLSSRHLH